MSPGTAREVDITRRYRILSGPIGDRGQPTVSARLFLSPDGGVARGPEGNFELSVDKSKKQLSIINVLFNV